MEAEKSAENSLNLTTDSASGFSSKQNWFRGEHGGPRSGWRLLLYFFIVIALGAAANLVVKLFGGPPLRDIPSPRNFFFLEVMNFALVFGAAFVMSRIERRELGEYGLPAQGAFGKNFWLGILLGLIEISVLMAVIAALGGYSFGELAFQKMAALEWGLFYGVFFVFVGLFEEFLFRGYTQFTLADGIGFWPAATLLSAIFGTLHYFNPGEGLVGAAGVFLVAMLFAFSLRRSGNLWYAVGMHASFDWGETYLFSVPNSGIVMPGHLSNALLHSGPKWLTGGTVGPEGSVFSFLTVALQFLVVMWLFPKKPAEQRSQTPEQGPV